MPESRVIRGEITIPPDAPPFTPAQAVVELEDISRADAPSEVVARLKLTPGELRGGDVISFTLDVPADKLNESHLYSVRVHLDLTGSQEIKVGDYITVQSYPVLTRGYKDEVRIAVRRI
jgi:uncharacterized lipoprotein YbaY